MNEECFTFKSPLTYNATFFINFKEQFSSINILKVFQLESPRDGGGGLHWVKFYWVRVAGLSEPLTHYSLFCGQSDRPHLSHAISVKYVIFAIPTESLSISASTPLWMKNTLLFTYSLNIPVCLLTVYMYVNMKNCLTQKSEHVRPHSSNSLENTTPL